MQTAIVEIHGLPRDKTGNQSDTCLSLRSKINGLLLGTPFLEKTIIEIFLTDTQAQEKGMVTAQPYFHVKFLDKNIGNCVAELLSGLGYPIYASPVEFGVQSLGGAKKSRRLANVG